MASNYRFFTTPIYYANGNPHAGHVYATILTSILKTHYVQRGMNVKFLTGLDEHGEAVQDKAKELGIEPQKLVDEMSVLWKNEFKRFGINNDIFIRTTDKDHIKNVSDILNYCYKKGDIYFGEHEGYYCVKCEGFLSNNERDENNYCLVHKRPTELRKEKNYFFRTSKYRNQLKEFISQGKITQQGHYINELLAMLNCLEGDLSISRPKTRLSWGVELPFDTDHVAYVWFDALPNYITGIGGLDAARTSEYWKNVHHILGKDILKFHGIFWPAMCLSLDLPLPKLLVTGWLLKDSHKMSKSLGNVVSVDQILHYGRDMFVNYVYRVTNPGDDIDISWKYYFERYNSDLANGVGNLLSRTLTMIEKYFSKTIPKFNREYLLDEQKEIEIAL
jgi:methionyl-tRNA synthetase